MPADTVPRNAEQVIPHTGGKTYNDVAAPVNAGYQSFFGTDNGLGGLQVTVSQTTGLVNQAVTVSVAGAKDGYDPTSGVDHSYLEVFQCWGAPGPDGKTPDPAATSPDPATCQEGVGGSDIDTGQRDLRTIAADPLITGGDWAGKVAAPFLAVDGTTVSDVAKNPYTSAASTNEISRFSIDSTGAGQRSFEMQTGAEAQGLGCGYRADEPSVRNCWLVAVPLNTTLKPFLTGLPNASGVEPSAWAQRLQVKLSFADVASSCPSGQAQTLSGGSELLSTAMTSWLPGVCSTKSISLGFSALSDYQARRQFAAGSENLIFTSQPVQGATSRPVYAPVAVAAAVIALNVDWTPCGLGHVITQDQVAICGYPDVATGEAEVAKAGIPLGAPGGADPIKLNARLVAKLLTQSYPWGASLDLLAKAPWFQPSTNLFVDPEFLSLNPEFTYYAGSSAQITNLQLEGLRSDSANQLWQWLVNDTGPTGAKSFLDGCPDGNGRTINPFYSTRTYTECASTASTLEAAAKAERDATTTPRGFDSSIAPSYPPSSQSYPQILWYEQAPIKNSDITLPETLIDMYPQDTNVALAAKVTFRANPPTGVWCNSGTTPSCAPVQWKSLPVQQSFGGRAIMGITDAANAARFQLQTAQLCDDNGTNCVAANTHTLTTAATRLVPTAANTVFTEPAVVNYKAGAYPLTMPVYAAVDTAGMGHADAGTIASVLDFLSTGGQTPGITSGQLPPGYAPLPAAMKAQAAVAITTLNAITDTPPATTSTATLPQAAPAAPPVAAQPVTGPIAAVPPPAAVPDPVTAPAPAAPASPAPIVLAASDAGQGLPVASGFPQYALLYGLGFALLAGILSPVIGRRRRKR
ncbi:hypothetical protein [Subtercola sp. RTI3]|uniref:hypothetical protein n=1 Tax=Subtercola sp. RTI3 TaxID=3048639 RepID=UPI002B23A3BF|nr:hypothetical protein [Subtercola sp. RTI3]MEA9986806.1 hypothetical protein [Subtercola sp. RTI3]